MIYFFSLNTSLVGLFWIFSISIGQVVLTSTSKSELEDFVAAMFYCLHALLTAVSAYRLARSLEDDRILLSGVTYTMSVPCREEIHNVH